MTKATELTTLADAEFIAKIDEGRRELFNLRFQLATGQLDNSARMGQVRREIARLLTIQRQREIAAYEAEVENA